MLALNSLCLYTTAFFMQVSFESIKEMGEFSIKNNKLFGFNFASEECFVDVDKFFEVIKYSDFLFCNK